jgi:orotate phosphoribosyltransferase-like protein
VIVGIALSGIPLATIIAVQEAAQLAIYHPAKQNQNERPMGSISGNFAAVSDQRCIIVDDTITSGNTMREVVKYLKKHNATPVAIWVIFDKRGIKDVDGVPVYLALQNIPYRLISSLFSRYVTQNVYIEVQFHLLHHRRIHYAIWTTNYHS